MCWESDVDLLISRFARARMPRHSNETLSLDLFEEVEVSADEIVGDWLFGTEPLLFMMCYRSVRE